MVPDKARHKILGFIREDTSAWIVAPMTFLVGAALTAVLAVANVQFYQHQLQQRFELLASERFSRIQERLDDQVQRLDALRRFFVYSDNVSQAEFNGFAAPLLIWTQAYSWTPKVMGPERQRFEQQARNQGLDGYELRELAGDGQFKVAAERSEYFPVLFTRSRSSVPLPYGFDVNSELRRHDTLQRALARDGMAASPRMNLVGLEPDNSSGVLLVAPVKARDGQSRDDLAGYVMAVISLRNLMAEGLPTQGQDNLSLTMLDLTVPRDPELLYQSASVAQPSGLKVSMLLGMADRDYLLEIRPTAAFLNTNQSSTGSLIILGGLLSAILSALLYSLVSQRQRALRLVQQRTAQLGLRERELRVTHGQLRNVLNAATQVAIIATDLNGVISTFNVGAQRMLGYSEEDVVGRFTLKDLHQFSELETHGLSLSERYGRQVSAAQAMFIEAIEDPEHQAREWTFKRRDGSSLVVSMLVTAVRDEQAQWVGYLAVCIDVTERKRVHESLAARDHLLEKLSAHVPGGIYQYQLDVNGSSRFNYCNSGMWNIYELPVDTMLDVEAAFARIHPIDLHRIKESIHHSAEHLSPWREEYRVELPSKGLRWLRGEATPECLPDGAILWHGFISDITDMKRVEEELRALSVTDVLTGVFNRRYFQERLKAELARVHRHGGELSVIMLDIDHFKRINDQHGHAVGDLVLQVICKRINQRLRRNDVFCRLGGEEFMVLCPGTDSRQAYELATELWASVRGDCVEGVGQVTASFGVASWRETDRGDALLLRADSGVYAAKQAGRDRVEFELP